jgi:hypothetical protein
MKIGKDINGKRVVQMSDSEAEALHQILTRAKLGKTTPLTDLQEHVANTMIIGMGKQNTRPLVATCSFTEMPEICL